jgi:hypothetical protein
VDETVALDTARAEAAQGGPERKERRRFGVEVTMRARAVEPIQPPLPRSTPDRERVGQGRHNHAQSLTNDGAAPSPRATCGTAQTHRNQHGWAYIAIGWCRCQEGSMRPGAMAQAQPRDIRRKR